MKVDLPHIDAFIPASDKVVDGVNEFLLNHSDYTILETKWFVFLLMDRLMAGQCDLPLEVLNNKSQS